jgi:hypothetical protein
MRLRRVQRMLNFFKKLYRRAMYTSFVDVKTFRATNYRCKFIKRADYDLGFGLSRNAVFSYGFA